MNPIILQALNISADLCRHFEGFSSKPYICPAGYATIGYGTVYKPDGTRVTMQHPPISKDTALDWLMQELEHNYMKAALELSPKLINDANALAAITSFIYNLGVGRYRASTLRSKINSWSIDEACKEIVKWNKGGGKVLRGLVLRREEERKRLAMAVR